MAVNEESEIQLLIFAVFAMVLDAGGLTEQSKAEVTKRIESHSMDVSLLLDTICEKDLKVSTVGEGSDS